MTDKITTYTYFLESKEKMEPLLKELFGTKFEINPNSIKPLPEKIDKENNEDINEWIWSARGFDRFDEQYYLINDSFSVIAINTNGFAAKLFTDFAKTNNLSYFSKIRNSSFFYYKDENTKFMFNVDFQYPLIDNDFDVLNCIDLSKVGVDVDFKNIENKFTEKSICFGNVCYQERIKFESEEGQKNWLDFIEESKQNSSNKTKELVEW